MVSSKRGVGSSQSRSKPAQRASRPGLNLTAESPVRALSSFPGFGAAASVSSTSTSLPAKARQSTANEATSERKQSNHGPREPVEVSKSSTEATREKDAIQANGQRLWSERIAPHSKSELAVHAQKITQVERWLTEALYGKPAIQKYRRICVISGPSGCGKSSLLSVLAQPDQLNFEIVEWNEENRQGTRADAAWDRGSRSGPSGAQFASSSRTAATPFTSFLLQSVRFSPLDLHEDAEPVNASESSATQEHSTSTTPRLVVIDDLPNLQHEPTRAAFQSALQSFISVPAHTSEQAMLPPLVILLSQSTPRLGEWDASNHTQGFKERAAETMSVHALIPENVRNHPGFAHIAMNAVARTLLRKALTAALSSERKRDLKRFPAPSSNEAKSLIEAVIDGCNGDVRNALNTMQLLLETRGRDVAKAGEKRRSNGQRKVTDALNSLSVAASGRESSLAIFHAVGKVLYNKREGDPKTDKKKKGDDDSEDEDDEVDSFEMNDDEQAWLRETMKSFGGSSDQVFDVPPHLQHLTRRKSRVDVERIWRTMPMDAATLQIFLHQHYPPFCVEIEEATQLIDNLSFAESLKPGHEEWLYDTSTSFYNFLISVQGTLMALPSPMPRNKEQRFRGGAFFDAIRRVRRTTEKLSEAASSLNLCDAGESWQRSTLAGASITQLASEVLPMIARCGRLSAELQGCVMNVDQSFHRNMDSSGLFDEDEEELPLDDVAALDEHRVPSRSRRHKVDVFDSTSAPSTTNDVQGSDALALDAEARREESEEDEAIDDFD